LQKNFHTVLLSVYIVTKFFYVPISLYCKKFDTVLSVYIVTKFFYVPISLRGLLEKYPTFGREKETGLPGALDT